jgi:hypothetical protein
MPMWIPWQRRSCIDAVFCLKLMLGKRREFDVQTYVLFLVYCKAFDQINRCTLFNVLHQRNIPDPLLSTLVKIYEHNEIKIRLGNKMTVSRNQYVHKQNTFRMEHSIKRIQLTRNKKENTPFSRQSGNNSRI